MKKLNSIAFLFLALALALVSCEETEDILNPEDERADLVGVWDVVENSETFGTQYYEVEFFATSSDETILYLANFFALGSWVEAEVELNDDVLFLPLQTLEGYQISGQGEISDDNKTIDFTYTTEEVATTKSTYSEQVTAVFTKQE